MSTEPLDLDAPVVYLVQRSNRQDFATFDKTLVEDLVGPLELVNRTGELLSKDGDATVSRFEWVSLGSFAEDRAGVGVAVVA